MDDIFKRNDEYFMRVALREAQKAFDADEVPVGAVIVIDDTIVAKAYNQVEVLNDATAHAEILAITQASAAINNWRMEEATLYVTKEPCAMCAGAMVNSRVKKVVYAVEDKRTGACGGGLDVTGFPGMLHNVETVSGVLQEEALYMLQTFFQMKRQQKKAEKLK